MERPARLSPLPASPARDLAGDGFGSTVVGAPNPPPLADLGWASVWSGTQGAELPSSELGLSFGCGRSSAASREARAGRSGLRAVVETGFAALASGAALGSGLFPPAHLMIAHERQAAPTVPAGPVRLRMGRCRPDGPLLPSVP